MMNTPFGFNGLSDEEVKQSRQRHGANQSLTKKQNTLFKSLKEVVLEPMFILLAVAASIYFILGETNEALFMTGAILLVSAISFYQDNRSRKALEALKEMTAPKARVIREGTLIEIASDEIVVGDYLLAEEGSLVAADGLIIQSSDFAVNESMLTGESLPVDKSVEADNKVFQGTQVVSGQAVFTVTAIGDVTELGEISSAIQDIEEEKTPLQTQIGNFVKKMALVGAVVFILIWGLNYFKSRDFLDSLLKGLTLAMSILPEEIPVAFSTFMALGAWRLMKKGIIVKQTKTVEALGAANVICMDKTGTITENRMELACLMASGNSKVLAPADWINNLQAHEVIKVAMFASESNPFDPMEKALHKAYSDLLQKDERVLFKMAHEFPLSGKPPMMTHVFENENNLERIIAAKGAPEAILAVCHLSESEREQILNSVHTLAKEGYRILGVAKSNFVGYDFPELQQQLPFVYVGLVAFYDPPKANIREVFQKFYNAGIQLKIITGDNAVTTAAIASQSGFKVTGTLEGDALLRLSDAELEEKVMTTNVFTRMFPEAKLRIINALKNRHQIVAMTGDGVNDGPALKAANIGIAMGKRGSELARSAASLVLTDDDIGKMVDAIASGRHIYTNLKKAIQYIISIHIPIILTVAMPLLLGWIYPNIFTPVHVIFLELIMGPTCSIIYESEPLEANAMQQPPRQMTQTFFSNRELAISVMQGMMIALGTLICYQMALQAGDSEAQVRTLAFVTLVVANVFLTLVNRSFYYSIFKTLRYKNWMLVGIVFFTLFMLALMLVVIPIRNFFSFAEVEGSHLLKAIGLGFVSVIWFELFKLYTRMKSK